MSEAPDTKMFCRVCSHNLLGLTGNRCPECGRPFDPSDAATFYKDARPSKKGLSILGIVLAACPITFVLSIHLAGFAGRFFYPIVYTLYFVTYASFFASIVFLLLGIVFNGDRWIRKRQSPSFCSWLLLIVIGISWIGSYLVAQWDPLRAFNRFFD